MDLKHFDSERRVMECLWSSGSLSAKEIEGSNLNRWDGARRERTR